MTAQCGDQVLQNRKKAMERLEQGLFLQAVWILEEILEKMPDSLSDRYLLALAYTKSEQLTEAEKSLRQVLDVEPEHAESIRLLAKISVKFNKTHQAIALLKQYARLRPYDPTVADDLFHCYLQLNELEKAYSTWFELSETLTSADTTVEFLRLAFQLRKFKTLQKVYLKNQTKLKTALTNQELETAPFYHACSYYALSLHELGLLLEAEEQFTWLRQNFMPEEPYVKAWQKISELTKKKRHTEFFLQAAVQTWPASRKLLVNLFEFYLKADPQKCLEELSKYDEEPDLLKIKAQAWRQIGQLEVSTDLLEKLFLHDPNDSSLPFELGVNYFVAGQKNKALKYFEYYRNHQLPPADLNYYLAACYFQADRNSIALRHLLLALEEETVCEKAWLMFLELVLNGLESSEIPLLLEKAVHVLRDHVVGLTRLVEIYQRQQPELCLNLNKRILELEPNNFSAAFYVALHYLQVNQYRHSCHYFHLIAERLAPEQLQLYCQAAEKSLDYATAFGLYLRLGQINLNLAEGQIINLIRRRDSFYDIFKRYATELSLEQEQVLQHVPLFYYKVALRHYVEKSPRLALKQLAKLEIIRPDYLRCRFFLGQINMEIACKEEALKYFEKAFNGQDKKKNQLLFLLSELYIENKNYEFAKRPLLRLFRQNFRREVILPHLFTVYEKSGQTSHFLKLLHEFSPESLQKPSVLMLFAEAFYQVGDYTHALLYFRQVPSHSSQGIMATFRAAQSLLMLNDKQEALILFERLKNNDLKPSGYHYFIGLNYFLLRRLKSAVHHFDLSCELGEYVTESLEKLIETAILDRNATVTVHYYLRLSALYFNPAVLLNICTAKLLNNGQLIELLQPMRERLIEKFPAAVSQELLSIYIGALCRSSLSDEVQVILEYLLEKKADFLSTLAALYQNDTVFLPLLHIGERLQPSNYYFPWQLATLYFTRGKAQESLKYYQKAESLFGAKPLAASEMLAFHRNCGTLYFRDDQLDLARTHVEKALEIAPSDQDLLTKLSYLCYKLDDLKGRALADQRLFFSKPDDPAVSFRLLEWYLSLDDTQNAIIHVKNYLRFYPDDQEKIKLLAQLSGKSSMFAQEIQAYEMLEKSAAKLDRDHYLKKGNAWLSLGRELKAAPCFQQYIAEYPENTGLRFQLARIYIAHQLWEKARFMLLEIMDIEPFNVTVQYELCTVLFAEKKYRAAIEELNKLLRNKPYHVEGYFLLARIHYEQGEYKKAVNSLDRVLENDSKHEQAKFLLARIFKAEGLVKEAAEELEGLYQRTGKTEYLLELGVLQMKTGRKESALKNFRSIRRAESDNSKLSRLAERFLRASNQ